MGNTFTKEEYLALVEELAKEQYDGDCLDEDVYMPSNWPEYEPENETEVKKKEFRANTNGQIDLTNTKSNKIKEELFKCANLKIGNFKIKIKTYIGMPDDTGSKLAMSLQVWEERHKTPSGAPCKIDYPMIFARDSRFANRSWIEYFGKGSFGSGIPVDTVVDIIRWMRALKRIGAFL